MRARNSRISPSRSRADIRRPPCAHAAGEVLAAPLHHLRELAGVARRDRLPQQLYGTAQRLQRFATIFVEMLDLEIEFRTFAGHLGRDVDLRVVGRARQLRETRRGLAAVRRAR